LDISGGIEVGGDSEFDAHLKLNDNKKLKLGVGGEGEIYSPGTHFYIASTAENEDIIFQGNDGGSTITALTLDMSNAGAATFNNKIVATELDISGDADIDGTLEADAYTVDGTALATYIRDTVGTNMLSSNTESGITVTYDTSNDNIDFAIDAAQTGITSLLATDIKIGEDDQTKIDFETADEIHFYANNTEQVYLADNIFGPQSDSDVDLGTTGIRWKDAYIDTITTTGATTSGGDITLAATKALKFADDKIIIGSTNSTLGAQAVSIGYDADSTGAQAIGIGYNPQATGAQAIGIGYNPQATGDQAIAIGNAPEATDDYSIALGWGNEASGAFSIAIGNDSEASGTYSVAIGAQGIASGTKSIVIGNDGEASGAYSVAIGYEMYASGEGTVAIGYNDTFSEASTLCTDLDMLARTSDGAILNLQTSDTTVTDGSVLGSIEFNAPEEASVTDAILVGAEIVAVAEGTFAADNNATELLFKVGASEAASTALTIASTKAATFAGNVTVSGNLTVSGTTTTVDSTTVAIADSMLKLAKDQGTSADAVDFGWYGQYGVGGTAKYAGVFRDLSATGDPFTFFDSLQAEPGATVDTGGTGYDLADISAGGITSADGFTGTLLTAAQANVTSLGTLTTLTVDNVIINGTTIGHTSDTDLLTLASGGLTVLGTITVGVDDTGHDVKFFGATSGKYMLWDESGDSLKFPDSTYLKIGTSDDFKMWHDGSNTYLSNEGVGHLYIQNTADDKDIIFKSDDGSGGTTTYITLDGDAVETVFSKNTRHNDAVLARFGAGNDLELQHDGNDSYITIRNHDLKIQQLGDDKSIIFYSDDGSGGIAQYFKLDGSAGYTTAQKDIRVDDGIAVAFGTDIDAFFKHSGSAFTFFNDIGDVTFTQRTDDGDIIFESDNGAGGTTEYFRLDGGDARMYATKEIRFMDGVASKYGADGDLEIYHSGSHGYLANGTGDFNITSNGGEMIFTQNTNDGNINFNCDDGSGGVTTYLSLDGGDTDINVYKNMHFTDNTKIKVGISGDLEIFHDGSNSYINETGTGNMYIQFYERLRFQDYAGGQGIIAAFNTDSSGCQLYYQNSLKLQTTSTGVYFPGTITVGVDDTGYDVKFFGATASAFMEWDESADELEIRGPLATPGKLLLSTAETTMVDGNKMGQIDFQAPLDGAGTDAILVGASIWAEADATFSSSVNATELVFATGASETAAEKMRIDSSGNVGIGTDSPAQNVEIKGAASAYTTLRITSGSTGHGSDIEFGDASDADYGSILQFATSAGEGGRMRFIAGGTETMNLRGGNVGIGTTSPSSILHVASATNPVLRVEDTTNSATVAMYATDSNLFMGAISNHSLAILTNDTPAITIDTSQNATFAGDITAKTSDGALLKLQTSETTVVDGDILGSIQFSAPNEGSGTDAILVGAEIIAVAEGTFAADNNATELLFKVGVSEAAATALTIGSNKSATFAGGILMGDYIYHTGDTNTYFGFSSNDTITFRTAATERFYISSDGSATFTGNVSVNGAGQKATFHVKPTGNGWKDAVLIEHYTGNTGWFLHPEDNSDNALWFGYNSDTSLTYANQGATVALKLNSDLSATFAGDITAKTSDGAILTLQSSDTTITDGSILGRIDFQAPNESDGTDAILVGASIYAEADDTFAADNNETELVFATGASAAASEKVRITSDGKVGIGTDSPANLLDVGGGDVVDPTIRIDSASGGSPTLIFDASQINRTAHIKFYDNGSAVGGFIDYLHNGDKMNFGSGSSTNATMTVGDTRVGIGTDAPTAKLDISGDYGGIGVRIKGDQTTAGTYYYGFMHDGANMRGTTQTNVYYAGGSVLADTTIATWASLRISTPSVAASNAVVTNNYAIYQESALQKSYFAGDVGIGTDSPNSILQLSSTGPTELLLSDTNAGSNVKNYGIYSDTGKLHIRRLTDAYSGYTPTITVDQSNVGIGTTTPTNPLSVEATIASDWVAEFKQGHSTAGESYGVNIFGGANSSDAAFQVCNQAGTGILRISEYGTSTFTSAASYPLTVKSTDADAADIFRVLADDGGAVMTVSKDASDNAEAYLYSGAGAANIELYGGTGNATFAGNVTCDNIYANSGNSYDIGAAGTMFNAGYFLEVTAYTWLRAGGAGNVDNEKIGVKATGGAGIPAVVIHNNATADTPEMIGFYTEASPTVRGALVYSNSTGDIQIDQLSDRSLKYNIKDLDGGLQLVGSLKPRTFNFRDDPDGKPGVKNKAGFIAQEVEEVKPEWVGEKNGLKTLPSNLTGGVVPYLIKAIQELEARVKELENK